MAEIDMKLKPCAILFVNPAGKKLPHPAVLRGFGFVVREERDWPADNRAVRDYQVIVLLMRVIDDAAMVGTRLRAKPHVGRRLLLALVAFEPPADERRSAQASGFDDVLSETCESRQLAARILRGIRARPELRCVLPRPTRSAA